MPTPQQIVNGQVAMCLYHCWTKLEKVGEEHTESAAALVRPGVKVFIFSYAKHQSLIVTTLRRNYVPLTIVLSIPS